MMLATSRVIVVVPPPLVKKKIPPKFDGIKIGARADLLISLNELVAFYFVRIAVYVENVSSVLLKRD